MEQYPESQYDDDLTIGADDYDDSFQTDSVDLFEFGGDEESPISKLKTLVLSIDWEITDEVLLQFNEELVDLKDVWAGERINLVYLQALEKLSRYIYREKADANPNAIKLLLALFYNLEKIVSTEDLTEEEKKKLLLEDIKRFEKLKQQISIKAPPVSKRETVEPVMPEPAAIEDSDTVLTNLKAIVLGIDWEITEEDLLALKREVTRLEDRFAKSRPKLIFLQGIGTLGAYIRHKKSNAHADAFQLLHSFYEGLEKIVTTPMSLAEEKEILLPEVDKFNAFKALIGPTLTPEALSKKEEEQIEDYVGGDEITPAFADIPEDQARGFQEEEEAASLGLESPEKVTSQIEGFFDEEAEGVVSGVGPAAIASEADEEPSAIDEAELFSDAFFGGEETPGPEELKVDKEIALQGVDVETEADDDSGEEALPREKEGELAPALAASEEISAFSDDTLRQAPVEEAVPEEITGRLDDFFGEGPTEEVEPTVEVPAEVALEGVDVEAPGDEEDEEAESIIAPAFADIEEETIEGAAAEEPEDLAEQLDDFFAMEEGEEGGEEVDVSVVDKSAVEIEESDLLTAMPQEMEAPPAAGEVEEEEVVFEPVEEEDYADIVQPETEVAEESPLETFFAVEEEPVEEFVVAADEMEEVEAEIPEAMAEEELAAPIAEPVEADTAEEELFEEEMEAEEPLAPVAEPDPLSNLQACVSSVELELEDSIFAGLFSEINRLRQHWVDRPVEKSYLQLLSTIGQHIDQYRYEASAEAHGLLVALFANLKRCQELDLAKAQEVLLSDTYKVLQWQQNMLNRQAVRRGSQLTFIDPIRSEASEESGAGVEISLPEEDGFSEDEFTAVFMAATEEDDEAATTTAEGGEEQLDLEGALAEDIDHEAVGEEDMDMELEEALRKEVEQAEKSIPMPSSAEAQVADVIRQELEAMRRTLLDEIAALRKELSAGSAKRE